MAWRERTQINLWTATEQDQAESSNSPRAWCYFSAIASITSLNIFIPDRLLEKLVEINNYIFATSSQREIMHVTSKFTILSVLENLSISQIFFDTGFTPSHPIARITLQSLSRSFGLAGLIFFMTE